jgi:hypothetical protein
MSYIADPDEPYSDLAQPKETIDSILQELHQQYVNKWQYSGPKEAIDLTSTKARLNSLIERIIGEDESDEWQRIYQSGERVQKIADPEVAAQNRLRAEQRKRLKLLGGN